MVFVVVVFVTVVFVVGVFVVVAGVVVVFMIGVVVVGLVDVVVFKVVVVATIVSLLAAVVDAPVFFAYALLVAFILIVILSNWPPGSPRPLLMSSCLSRQPQSRLQTRFSCTCLVCTRPKLHEATDLTGMSALDLLSYRREQCASLVVAFSLSYTRIR